MDTVIKDIYPLSHMQKGILFQSLLDSHVYFEQFLFEISEIIDIKFFTEAWQKVIDMHDILRTVFDWEEGEPIQIVLHNSPLNFAFHDISNSRDYNTLIDRENINDREKGFNLAEGPLFRIILFKISDAKYIVRMSYHHILLDGGSFPILIHDFFYYYTALKQHTIAVSINTAQYKSYIKWLLDNRNGNFPSFWKNYLEGYSIPAMLPIQKETTTSQGGRLLREQLAFSPTIIEELISFSKKNRITINNILEAIWALVIMDFTGLKDIIFGTTFTGKPTAIEGIDTMAGLFINTVPVRVKISSQSSFLDVAKNIQSDWIAMQETQYTPLSEIKKYIDMPHNLDPFQAIFVFGNQSISHTLTENAFGHIVRLFSSYEMTNYDLTIDANRDGDDISLYISYQETRVDRNIVREIAERYNELLNIFTKKPSVPVSDILKSREHIHPPKRQEEKSSIVDSKNCKTKEIEAQLLQIWKDILPYQEITPSDSFFDIGGDSIFCIMVVSQLTKLGYKVSVKQVFENPTISALAEEIGNSQSSQQVEESEIHTTSAICASYIQEAVLQGSIENDLPYHEQAMFEYEGKINYNIFEEAWIQVINANTTLRTIYKKKENRYIQTILENPKLNLTILDLSNKRPKHREESIEKYKQEDLHESFLLDESPMVRIALFKISETTHIFCLSFSVLAIDGWCFAFVMKDFYDRYTSLITRVTVPENKRKPYTDYIQWLQKRSISEALSYWKKYLEGSNYFYYVSRDKEKMKQPIYPIEIETATIVEKNKERIIAIAKREGITLNSLLRTIWAQVLSLESSTKDIVIGATVSGRPPEIDGVEEIVGLFFNDIPVRTIFSPDKSIFRIAKDSQSEFANSLSFDYISNRQIKEILERQHDDDLFQSIFIFENYPKSDEKLLKSSSKEYMRETNNWRKELATIDINVYCEVDIDIIIEIKYIKTIFYKKTIKRLLNTYCSHLLSLT